MKVLFYSDDCKYCKKMLLYLDKYNIKSEYKLIDINNKKIPININIDIVPTIIDTELNQPLKGKKAFEYLTNIKYFNNETNNIEIAKKIPPNPDIPIDDKANQKDINQLSLKQDNNESLLFNENKDNTKNNESLTFYENNKNNDIINSTKEMANSRQIQDTKLITLLKIRGR